MHRTPASAAESSAWNLERFLPQWTGNWFPLRDGLIVVDLWKQPAIVFTRRSETNIERPNQSEPRLTGQSLPPVHGCFEVLKETPALLLCRHRHTPALSISVCFFFFLVVLISCHVPFFSPPYDSWTITCTLLENTGYTLYKLSQALRLLHNLPGGSDCRPSIDHNSLFPFKEVRCNYITLDSDEWGCDWPEVLNLFLSWLLLIATHTKPHSFTRAIEQCCARARPALTRVSLWKMPFATERLHDKKKKCPYTFRENVKGINIIFFNWAVRGLKKKKEKTTSSQVLLQITIFSPGWVTIYPAQTQITLPGIRGKRPTLRCHRHLRSRHLR